MQGEELLRCVVSPPPSPPSAPPDVCPLRCGSQGACVRVSAGAGAGPGWRCACSPLYEGARCDRYRCAGYCNRRGVCRLDDEAPADENGVKPLKVRTHIYR